MGVIRNGGDGTAAAVDGTTTELGIHSNEILSGALSDGSLNQANNTIMSS